jgi:hypothetical protein
MAAGGVAVLPVTPCNFTPGLLLPTHAMAFWPYTRMTDPRFTWGDDYVLLRQDTGMPPAKVGIMNETGWAAYVFDHATFIKFFTRVPGAEYVDFGTNLQSWTNKDCLELETLGQYKTLELEETVTHDETWYFEEGIAKPQNDADVKKSILPIVQKVLKK